MSKPYLLEVLNDYNEIEKNIPSIIRASGYRTRFIAEKLNLPISTFYFKRKTKTFTPKEVTQIVRMIDDEDDDVVNKYELELAKSRADDENISADELLGVKALTHRQAAYKKQNLPWRK